MQDAPADHGGNDPGEERKEGRDRDRGLPGRVVPGLGSHRDPLERYGRLVRGCSEEDEHDGPPDGRPFRDGEDCTHRPG